jgi:AraC-like DNA-binding protein
MVLFWGQNCANVVTVAVREVRMEEASSFERYVSSPVGRYIYGPSYVVWWKSVQLNGILLWGRPDEEHILNITRALDAELAPAVSPHGSLIDARRVCGVDPAAFNTLLRYVATRREAFSRLVTRQAVLRPDGLAGAAIAGFYAVLAPSYPVHVFTEPRAALAWLGPRHDLALCSELDGITARLTDGSVVVVALRGYLERSLGSASIARAARALRLSERSLQRQLQEAGTSFRSELNLAQVRAAKALMLDTSYELKRVATQVGCASPQNFSSLFKRLEGFSPSEWRARNEGDSATGVASARSA